jgi:ribonuclease HII
MYTIGVDEAGRGPLIGPVVVAAVILADNVVIPELTDSKKLSATTRAKLAAIIQKTALAYNIQVIDAAIIDDINILQATLLGMRQAVAGINLQPISKVLVDGLQCPQTPYPTQAVVQGDLLEPAISAASILAKVHRDALMCDLALKYPNYALEQHKGYPTKLHLELLHQHGPTSEHRKSFKPVRALLATYE